MIAPASLRSPDLAPLWVAVRERLERQGSMSRGRLRIPPLSTTGRHTLTSLLGRSLTATVDLRDLELALERVGAGSDLVRALSNVGQGMSFEAEERRNARRRRADARDAARAVVAQWPEVWAASWITDVIQAGLLRDLDAEASVATVGDIRRCVEALSEADHPRSRVDLAARVLGDSHALDPGTRHGAALVRWLRHHYATELHDDTDRTVWDRAGAPSDSVSSPVLTWNLPVQVGERLHPMVSTATGLGVVAHLSQMALRTYPVRVEPGSVILATENPRVVEAAAQRRSDLSVISTNGNPSAAVRLLLDQLLLSGAEVRYHGDFDAAGLSICRRMAAIGLRPWRMTADDYQHALDAAEHDRVELPVDDADPGPTPWDESLREVFRLRTRVVHEERLLYQILG